MSTAIAPLFDAPDLAAALTTMSDLETNALNFGVVEMNHDCKVLRYNSAESQISGLPPDRVIGRHFFVKSPRAATICTWRSALMPLCWIPRFPTP